MSEMKILVKKIFIYSSIVLFSSNIFYAAINYDIWEYVKKDQKFLTESIYYEKLRTLDNEKIQNMAKNCRNKGEKLAREQKYKEVPYYYLFAGICFEELGEFDKSGECLIKAGLYFKRINNLNLASDCYKNAADHFGREERKKELSSEFYKEAAECLEKINENRLAARTFRMAGIDYEKISKYKDAAISYEKAGDIYLAVHKIENDPFMIKKAIESYIEAVKCRKKCTDDYNLEISKLLKKSIIQLEKLEEKFADSILDKETHNKIKYDLYFNFFIVQLEINGRMDYKLFKKTETIAPDKKYYYKKIGNLLEEAGILYWSEMIMLEEKEIKWPQKGLSILWIKLRWGNPINLAIYFGVLLILPIALIKLNRFNLFELSKENNVNLEKPKYIDFLKDIACIPNSKIEVQKKIVGLSVLLVLRILFIVYYNIIIYKLFS